MTYSTITENGHTYQIGKDDGGNEVFRMCVDPIVEVKSTVLTKLEFRRLFTLTERVAIDDFENSGTLTAQQKATVRTLQYDLSIAQNIDLKDPLTIQGVQLLETYGLIATGRAAEILAT